MTNNFQDIKNGKTTIKRFFLVDYENVQSYGLEGLEKLGASDSVMVYFSDHADTLSFEMHLALNATKAKTDFQKVGTGVKNALDFQLSSQLGYIINQNIVAGNKNVKYYVVSRDNGFSCLGQFWARFGAEVRMVKSIISVLEPRDDSDIVEAISVFGLSEKDENAIEDAVARGLTGVDLHNAIQHIIKDSARASAVYKSLKEVLTEREKAEK